MLSYEDKKNYIKRDNDDYFEEKHNEISEIFKIKYEEVSLVYRQLLDENKDIESKSITIIIFIIYIFINEMTKKKDLINMKEKDIKIFAYLYHEYIHKLYKETSDGIPFMFFTYIKILLKSGLIKKIKTSFDN